MPGLIRAFLYPGPGPDHIKERTSPQKYIPARKRPQVISQALMIYINIKCRFMCKICYNM